MQPEKEDANQTAPSAEWQYRGDEPITEPQKSKSIQPVSWTASEFVAHQKSAGWFLMLAMGAVFGAGMVFLLTRDYISSAMVLIVVVLFGIFAARQPRVLHYSVDEQGIHIESKNYPFRLFKSFAVQDEGPIQSISLLPMRRFMPAISIYYPQEEEKRILGVLGNFLPIEERPHDIIDRFMHKIRF
jgi:hypothetical protein